jgi:hypothetical protein
MISAVRCDLQGVVAAQEAAAGGQLRAAVGLPVQSTSRRERTGRSAMSSRLR